ncbi:MAG: alpha-(1-_3)-arabinofuranosyltransferase family protein, partial [Actinomycetota bacterium]
MTHEHDVVRVDEQPVVMSAWRTRLWPVGLVYSALAIWAVFTNAGSHYIGDNRFEQYVNPARRLAKSFGVWDPTRGLGAPREDAWPGTTIPGAVFRALGMSPWAAERMFHAICLVTMALGVTALVRLFRPRLGVEHIVAGLYAGFGPYSAAFLVPSNLYYMMALGPWLVVAMVRGLTGTRPWRWAGVFALLVAWAGNPDPPGLIYNGIILIIAAVYLVLVERAVRWRDVAKWTAGTVSLAVLCSAWTLAKTFYARDMLNARLIDTELPSVSALTSSSSESLRGLGNWLSYFRDQGILMKPQGVTFFMNALVVSA